MKHRTPRGASAHSPSPLELDAETSAFFRRARDARVDHKTLQLCRQAFRALSLALGGECGDPILQSLSVYAVTPAPNAGRLLVDLCRDSNAKPMPPHEILERLEGVRGLLRHAVAESIVRKRAPELIFRIVSPDYLSPSEEKP